MYLRESSGIDPDPSAEGSDISQFETNGRRSAESDNGHDEIKIADILEDHVDFAANAATPKNGAKPRRRRRRRRRATSRSS